MDKPTIPEVIARFAAYYARPENRAWGSLHLVLDDGNVMDQHVAFCQQIALERGDQDGAELAAILKQMSKSQRIRLPFKVYAWIDSHKPNEAN